jgi:hypothetical protein
MKRSRSLVLSAFSCTTFALVLAFGVAIDAQERADACLAQVAPAVARLLTQRLPTYRLAHATDSTAENVRYDKADGGTGCLFVATGDFNGDRAKDFAVALIPITGKVPVVAVALSQKGSWRIDTLKSWVDETAQLYVSSLRPGLLKRSGAVEGHLDQNERRSLRCVTDALQVGATESTGIAYCHVNNRWLYVWVSD